MRTSRFFAISLAAAFVCFDPPAAQACGGTFCDTGPQSMPVDQSGENILFVIDGQNVEAHVQIQYQGSAERFAWIVPMPEVPDVQVGSQLLFRNLLQATVPTYSVLTQSDQCGGPNGAGGSGGALGMGGSGGGAGSGGDAGGPSVVFDKTVGAFQVVVLKGGTAQEVSDWLNANNYQTIPSAPTILQDYVAQNYVFVAVKLTAGASADEIHPLVFKYPGTEPCVPLKLTAVAATEDMGVRAFFLGDDRVVPTNYKHVELNPVRINWQTFGSNYGQSVSRGADSSVANGKAFVTEYAGASSAVSLGGVYSASWSSAAFTNIAPEGVVQELTTQNLMWCSGNFCQFNHPLVQPLLNEYLPVPQGLDESTFYGCLDCYKTQIDTAKWNAASFAADFKTRIEDPGKHAQSLLAKWPYLTRLYTTISPSEMNEDPMFHAQPGLPTVNRFQQSTLRITCDGQRGMLLPDGREVALDGAQWPVWDSLMPWAEEIAEYPVGGQKIVLVDNTSKINALLAEWNGMQGWPPSGGSGGASGAGGAAAGGSSGFGGSSGGVGGGSSVSPGGGGGCALGGRAPLTGGVLLAGLVALAAARRRKRRARKTNLESRSTQ